MSELRSKDQIRGAVETAVAEVALLDIHTHIYPPSFGGILLWGIDELLTYHYLVAELFRQSPRDFTYDRFWKMPKREQADLIWQTLFIENSPLGESCRGVLTCMEKLGLDVSARDLAGAREYFDKLSPEEYVDIVFEKAGVEAVVMTNNPFDDEERPSWETGAEVGPRFKAALRIDNVLVAFKYAAPKLRDWGYEVADDLPEKALAEIRRFLTDWIDRMGAVYMAASLPPDFAFPEDSPCGRIIAECVLPVSREKGVPFAMMVGVKKLVNPPLRLAGDGVGLSDLTAVENLCRDYPENKFLVTALSRDCQHELTVLARKFRNLMIFGCWWFLNDPSIIEEMTRMRMELLGLSFIPQHSDARVLDQLIYKWAHSRRIIADVLVEKYGLALDTGWVATTDEVERDVASLFRGNFSRFLEA